jgi:hypothetical protein
MDRGAATRGWRVSSLWTGTSFSRFLLLVFTGASCAVHPPHYVGDTRNPTASHEERPSWTQWGLTFQKGYAYIPGTSTHADRRKALAAAEEQGRNRLAAAIETRIISELEDTVTLDATRTDGTTTSVTERHDVQTRLRALADVVIQGATPEAEYWEAHEEFGTGWETRYTYWVLVKFPESEYYRQLKNVRGEK